MTLIQEGMLRTKGYTDGPLNIFFFFYLEVVYKQFSSRIISKLFWRNDYRMFDSS